jgi:hypothetical protein
MNLHEKRPRGQKVVALWRALVDARG